MCQAQQVVTQIEHFFLHRTVQPQRIAHCAHKSQRRCAKFFLHSSASSIQEEGLCPCSTYCSAAAGAGCILILCQSPLDTSSSTALSPFSASHTAFTNASAGIFSSDCTIATRSVGIPHAASCSGFYQIPLGRVLSMLSRCSLALLKPQVLRTAQRKGCYERGDILCSQFTMHHDIAPLPAL